MPESRTIHLRGLHYALVSDQAVKPDGKVYANDAENWDWLGDTAAFARWLGYLPWERITDEKNDPPEVRLFEPAEPEPVLYTKAGVDGFQIPSVDDLEPRVGVLGFEGVQPRKLVIVGEKSSLKHVLGPIAFRYQADLYLPSGDISNTLVHQMAKIGAEDGRPMEVLYFSDCDPSGWDMPIIVARKLQAFKSSLCPNLEFQVHRVALTPNQVREHDLPSTPLKPKEKRADHWREQMGVNQTEIDALATLQPELLRRIARDALDPFFDSTLSRRTWEAHLQWLREAQAVIDADVDQEHRARVKQKAAEKLDRLRAKIDATREKLALDLNDFDLPEPVVPEAVLPQGGTSSPLLDSRWSWTEQTLALMEAKEYRGHGNDAA